MQNRWTIDSPADGATNMARDEAILQAVGGGRSPATLRFYQWQPATISLGYFQRFADYTALPPPAGMLPVVRRQTGGGAILHDLELTYSLTLPLSHPLTAAGGPHRLYEHVHSAFSALLRRLDVPVVRGPAGAGACSHGGPFFCFEHHTGFDLVVNGKKILGSAQRRTPTAVLQHGSLILERRYEQQSCAAVADFVRIDIREHLPALAQTIFDQDTGRPTDYSSEENQLTAQLVRKYADKDWTCKR